MQAIFKWVKINPGLLTPRWCLHCSSWALLCLCLWVTPTRLSTQDLEVDQETTSVKPASSILFCIWFWPLLHIFDYRRDPDGLGALIMEKLRTLKAHKDGKFNSPCPRFTSQATGKQESLIWGQACSRWSRKNNTLGAFPCATHSLCPTAHPFCFPNAHCYPHWDQLSVLNIFTLYLFFQSTSRTPVQASQWL